MKEVIQTRPFREDRRLLLLFGAALFLFAFLVRSGDAQKWDDPSLAVDIPAGQGKVDHEYIMGTHDAYFWLAGAERIGSATDSAMSIFLDVAARITKIPDGVLAFWAPAYACALVAVLGFLWGRLAAGIGPGIFTGMLSSLSPGFYFRTRLGYFDTDIATLLFPLAVSFGLALWLNPVLRTPWLGACEPEAERPRTGDAYPLLLGLFAAFGGWWHNDIATFNLICLFLALVLILALARWEDKGDRSFGLLLFALPVLAGFFGLAAAAALYGLARHQPKVRALTARMWWVPLALVLVLLAATGNLVQPFHYALAKIGAYMKPAQEASVGTLAYPSITQSIVEAQNLAFWDILDRFTPWPWISLAGLICFFLLVLVRPVALFMVPLVLLSLLSVKIGARMSMFGGVGVALGLAAGVHWLLKWSLAAPWWRRWIGWAVFAALGAWTVTPWLTVYVSAPPTPVLSKAHAQALVSLSQVSPPSSQVWTWWDWGYATDYYARRKSFADGGKHSGSRVYPLGLALVTPSPLQSHQIIRFIGAVGKDGGDGSEEMGKWSAEEAQNFIDSLATNTYTFPRKAKQYLVVTWENIRLLYWISFYGSWNFKAKSAGHVQCLSLDGNFSLDENTGLLSVLGGQPVPLSSLDRLTPRGVEHRDFPNAEGAHMVYSDLRQSGFLLDQGAYRSMAVQLLLADVNDPRFTEYFHLDWEGFPEVRIYEVL